MKKKIEVEVTVCDICETDRGHKVLYTCLGCGKLYCYDCMIRYTKKFQYKVFAVSLKDGVFCNECLADKPKEIIRLLRAYKRITRLTIKHDMWQTCFMKEVKKAEEDVKKRLTRRRDELAEQEGKDE